MTARTSKGRRSCVVPTSCVFLTSTKKQHPRRHRRALRNGAHPPLDLHSYVLMLLRSIVVYRHYLQNWKLEKSAQCLHQTCNKTSTYCTVVQIKINNVVLVAHPPSNINQMRKNVGWPKIRICCKWFVVRLRARASADFGCARTVKFPCRTSVESLQNVSWWYYLPHRARLRSSEV